MYSSKVKGLLLGFVILVNFEVYANEDKSAKEAQKQDVKEETAAVVEPIKADEWLELNNRVATLKVKIKMRQDTLKKLVEEKQTEKSPQKVAEILKSMMEEHKGLQKEAAEYNKQSSILMYRFPEKSLAGEKRKYERVEVGTLEQLEDQLTLDAKIKKTVSKAQKQFPLKNKPRTIKSDFEEKRQQAIDPSIPNNLTEPIVIQK